jgi:hypothetical protein
LWPSHGQSRGEREKKFLHYGCKAFMKLYSFFFRLLIHLRENFFEIKSMGPNVNRIWTRRTKALIVARCPLGHMKEGSMSFV